MTTVINKTKEAIEQAENIRNDRILAEDYAEAGKQQAYIHGLSQALELVEIGMTITIDKYNRFLTPFLEEAINENDWFKAAKFHGLIKGNRQVAAWLNDEEMQRLPQADIAPDVS